MSTEEPLPGPRVSYSRQFRRCNKVDCPSCRLGGLGHGPYWYAYWREDGRRRSRYVGKQLPPEAVAGHVPEETAVAAAPDHGYPPLRVRTLGGFAVWQGALPLPAGWAKGKPAGLFKCLLSAPRHRMHREQLAELLRPDADPTSGALYLRSALHRLRRALGERKDESGYLRMESDVLILTPAPNGVPADDWLDAPAFERAARKALAGSDAAACRTALALYTGDYLPDDLYDERAVTRREELRGLYLALLLHLADLRMRDGVLGEAARCLRAVLAADPCHERAAQNLMRVQVAAGRATEAIQTYRQVTEALRRDLDLEPDTETEAQYQAALDNRQTVAKELSNLPTPLTSFLGREREMGALAQLLADRAPADHSPICRLLTVTGSGGCGKTRLAIELGHELRPSYPEGLWLVELAALPARNEADPTMIARQTAEVLGLRPDPAQSPFDTLVTFLRKRRALLILDNCEHVVAGTAAFAVSLLGNCPNPRILATSREALGIQGETVWRLPTLAFPNRSRDGDRSVQELGRHASVRLLVERARLVRPDFALTLDNCRAVSEICYRLDGVPLAIELAAARLSMLSPGDLAARLHDRFRLLTAGNRAAAPRHQTLGAVMDWSYALLSSAEQAMLRMLSVFASGWSLDAVEHLYLDEEGSGALDLLGRLASKSLVQIEDAADNPARYRLLETVRHYAEARLREHGEEAGARDRHLDWFLRLAERAASELEGHDQSAWLARLEVEHDNLRAALAWSVGKKTAVNEGLRLGGALWRFWAARSHWHEGRQWLATVLAQEGGTPAARLRALRGLGHLAINQGDHTLARAVYEESLALGRAMQNSGEVANALNGLGNVARFQGDLERAGALYGESLTIYKGVADIQNIARALHNLACVAQEEGDYNRAIAVNEESLVYRRKLGDRHSIAYTRYNQAVCTRLSGDHPRAAVLLDAVLLLFDELGDVPGSAGTRNELGRIAAEQGRVPEAVTHLRASTQAYNDLGDRAALIDVLENWAVLARINAKPALAVRLFGAIEAARQAIGHPVTPGQRVIIDADIGMARRLLDAVTFAAEWVAGQSLTLADVVAEALALYPANSD